MHCTDIFTICVASTIECDLEIQLPKESEDCIEVVGKAGTRSSYTIPFTYSYDKI